MSSKVPAPPPPGSLHPLFFTWEKDRPLFRCHSVRFGPTAFNPGKGLGRFHPFPDPGGSVVPVLYAAENLEGALSETVFHSVPFQDPGKRIRRITLEPLVVYRTLYDASGLWVRPHAMFFSQVTVDGRSVRRFAPMASEQ